VAAREKPPPPATAVVQGVIERFMGELPPSFASCS
jgi:hypothetical protein